MKDDNRIIAANELIKFYHDTANKYESAFNVEYPFADDKLYIKMTEICLYVRNNSSNNNTFFTYRDDIDNIVSNKINTNENGAYRIQKTSSDNFFFNNIKMDSSRIMTEEHYFQQSTVHDFNATYEEYANAMNAYHKLNISDIGICSCLFNTSVIDFNAIVLAIV